MVMPSAPILERSVFGDILTRAFTGCNVFQARWYSTTDTVLYIELIFSSGLGTISQLQSNLWDIYDYREYNQHNDLVDVFEERNRQNQLLLMK